MSAENGSLKRTGAAWRGRLAMMLVVAGMTAACESPEERVAKHFARGQALLEQNEPAKARLEFRNALKIDQDHVPSRLEIAKLQETTGDLRAAVGGYRQIVELAPDDVEARVRLAKLLALGGNLDEAVRLADAALALRPDDPETLSLKATVAQRVGNIAEAVRYATKAMESDPLNAPANLVLIMRDMTAGDVDAALERTNTLLASSPNDLAINLVKMQILERAGRDEALGAHLRAMTETFPERRELRQALARWHLGRGETDQAEAELRRIARENPSDPAAALAVVSLIAQTQGRDAGRAALVEAAEGAANPDVASALRLALADADIASGRIEDARGALRTLAESLGDTPRGDDARLRLARIAFSQDNDPAAAKAIVDTVLQHDASNVDALAMRAALLLREDRPEDAQQAIVSGLSAAPDNVRLLMLSAEAHERMGNLNVAGEQLASAVRASDFAAEVTLRYATFLQDRGQLREAETMLSEAVRRSPEDRALLTRLAETRLRLSDWVGAEEVSRMLSAVEGGTVTGAQVAAAALQGQGRTDAGIAVLEALVDKADDSAALSSLVAAYVRKGEIDKARSFVDTVLSENPGNLRALLLSAELHALKGDLAAAEASLRDIIARAPDREIGYLALARLKTRLGDLAAAEETLKAALPAITAEGQSARLLLAALLERRRAFDEAIEVYSDLYRIDSGSIVVANNLASLIADHQSGDAERLDFASRVAQRLRGSEIPEFQDTYGWVTLMNGDVDQALRYLVPAAEALPDNAIVRYHLGVGYARAGRAAEARSELEAALAIDPTLEAAKAALADLPS